MDRPRFRDLFCEHFNCPPADYERRAFRQCLYWHARWLAPIVVLFDPDAFKLDMKFIRYLGESTGYRDALEDRGNFHHANTSNRSFLRTFCKIRVSGPKAAKLARAFFEGRGV